MRPDGTAAVRSSGTAMSGRLTFLPDYSHVYD